jgi:nucleoside-diphosphate-sugar epimerase
VATILVTGAAGFIGARLTEQLSERGHTVIALDCFLPNLYSAEMKRERFEQLRNLPGVSAIECDLRTDDLSVIPEVDIVVNEAAMAGLTKSWDDFTVYMDNNVMALERLIRRTSGPALKKFIQISTSSVYGRMAEVAETGPTEPVSPYGVSKLAAEKLGFAYRENFGLPFVALRYFSVYGVGQRPDMAYHRFLAAARDGSPITVYGDGEQRRTNTYVDDCVEGTIAAIDSAAPGEVYNLSGVESYSINEVLELITTITGKALDVRYEPARAGDQRETRGVITKAQSELGYAPRWSLEDGLRAEWEWIQTLPAEFSIRP